MRIAVFDRNIPAYATSKPNLKKIIHENDLDDALKTINLYGGQYIAVEKHSSNAINRQVLDSSGQWQSVFKDFVVYKQLEGKPVSRCSQCGRLVQTEGGVKDKRTRFCSRECEKKFWKRPHWEHKDNAMQNAPGWKLKLREQSCD